MVRSVPWRVTLVAVTAVPAVAETVAWVAPAGTVTERGTESSVELELLRVTTVPPTGAAAEKVTVRLPVVPEARDAAEYRLATSTAAAATCIVTVAVLRTLPCITTLVGTDNPVTVTGTSTNVAPAGTTTEAGTGITAAFELAS